MNTGCPLTVTIWGLHAIAGLRDGQLLCAADDVKISDVLQSLSASLDIGNEGGVAECRIPGGGLYLRLLCIGFLLIRAVRG